MANLKIKVESLNKILSYAESKGKTTNNKVESFYSDCLFKLDKSTNTLQLTSIDENQTLAVLVDVKLKKGDITEDSELPILLETALDAAKRFKPDDVITLEYTTENVKDKPAGMLIYERKSPKLSIKRRTVLSDDIVNSIPRENLTNVFKYIKKGNYWQIINVKENKVVHELKTRIKIDSNQFSEVIKDGEDVKFMNFPFRVTKKAVFVNTRHTQTLESIERELTTIETEVEDDVESIYSKGFGNAFTQISGTMEIWLGNGLPMIIKKEKDNISVTYILSAIVLEEEYEIEEVIHQGSDISDIEDQLRESLEDEEEDDRDEEETSNKKPAAKKPATKKVNKSGKKGSNTKK